MTTEYLRKKPRSKKHLHKPSKQCEVCDQKLNSILYMLQVRGCTNCGKSGCKQCVKYSRTFDNGQDASVCKNCKDLPKKIKNVHFVKKQSEVDAKAEDVPVIEELDENDMKADDGIQQSEQNIPLEEIEPKANDMNNLDSNVESNLDSTLEPVLESNLDSNLNADTVIVPMQNESLLSSKIEDLSNELSRLEREAEEERLQVETARQNEKLALSRFKEISAENNKLKGELKQKELTRTNSFDSSSVLLTRLDEIQMISEGRDQELINVGKQMDDLVHQLQITEAQKHKALEELQTVQTNQIEQLEQIVGRLSTQKSRTMEIKQKLQSAVDERDYHKKIAKLKEQEINDLMAENDKLREILEDTDSSSTSSFSTPEPKTVKMTQNDAHIPVKLVVDLNEKSPPSNHAEVQTYFEDFSNDDGDSSGEEDWEKERRKMQSAMENLRQIIRKWKENGVVEPSVVVV